MDKEEFAKIRKKLKKNKKQFADLLGITEEIVSQYERGLKPIKKSTAITARDKERAFDVLNNINNNDENKDNFNNKK